jgi:hypothetical protein
MTDFEQATQTISGRILKNSQGATSSASSTQSLIDAIMKLSDSQSTALNPTNDILIDIRTAIDALSGLQPSSSASSTVPSPVTNNNTNSSVLNFSATIQEVGDPRQLYRQLRQIAIDEARTKKGADGVKDVTEVWP